MSVKTFIVTAAEPSSHSSTPSHKATSPDSSSETLTLSSGEEVQYILMENILRSNPPRSEMQGDPCSAHHVLERDTFLGSGRGAEGESGESQELLLSSFQMVSYSDVDTGQQEEFQYLIKRESSWHRVFCHKGTVANVFFLIIMAVGIILGEVLFPQEGVRGQGTVITNDTDCLENLIGCFSVRVLRGFGLFGFIGGVTNWIAIEMMFVRVPFLCGTGVIASQYKNIREGIRRIVVNTLFDPDALREYFSDRRKNTIGIVHLEQYFGGLLTSTVANDIIDRKIEEVLCGPKGFVLTAMGVDLRELQSIVRRNVHSFVADISPIILDKMSQGIADGEGLQAEVERILEQKIEDLSSQKVKQLVALIIRKHLSWLILWGNISGALIGLIAEAATIVAAKLNGMF